LATLQYDLSIVGLNKLRSGTQAIERELTAHARRTESKLGIGRNPAARRSLATREQRSSLRAFDEIGKAGVAAERRRHAEAMRNIKAEERAKQQAIKAEERERKRALRQQEQEQRRAVATAQATRARFASGAASSLMGATGRTLGIGAGVLGLGGGAAIYGAVDSEVKNRAAISNLANQGYVAGGPSRSALAAGIRGNVAGVANASGRSDADLVEMAQAFTDVSGDLKGAMKLLPQMAELADASGASGSDIGRSMALALEGVKIRGGKGLSDTDAELRALAAIRVMAGQGKIGSIELADQANAGAGRTVAAAMMFGGDFEKNMATLGGLAQMAVKSGGAASSAEAFMSISKISTDVTARQASLRKMGVEVFTDKSRTALRDPAEIMYDIVNKTKGDLTKLGPIFNERSIRALNPLQQVYTEAGGGEAGEEAMRSALGKFQQAALGESEVKDSAAFRRTEPDRQLERTKNEFNRLVGSELIPVLSKAIPELAKAIPSLVNGIKSAADFAQWFIDNPVKGVGAIIAAQVALDVAKAGIGKVIVGMLASASVPGTGIGAAGAAAGGGALATLGWAGAAVGSTALAINELSDLNKISGHNKGRRFVGSLNPFKNNKGEGAGLGGLLSGLNPFSDDFYARRLAVAGANSAQGLWDTMGTDAADQARNRQGWEKREAADSLNGLHDYSDWVRSTDGNMDGGLGPSSPWAAGFGLGPDSKVGAEAGNYKAKQEAAIEASKSPAQKQVEAFGKAADGAAASINKLAEAAANFDPSAKRPDRGGVPTGN